jgi:class 3 adenylate cyclase/putative methionine-R-sulfoxide reductase with GAF domain
MRPIRSSAFGAGIASGIAAYACIRFYQEIVQPGFVFDLLAALGVGLAFGVCYYLVCKFTLRRAVQHFRAIVTPVVGAALPPIGPNPLEDLQQIYDRAVKVLTRPDRYSAIVEQLRSSEDVVGSFWVIADQATRVMSADSAALFLREGVQLRAAAAWNLDGTVLLEAEQGALFWRALQENRALIQRYDEPSPGDRSAQAASLIVAPIVVANRPVGVFVLANRADPAAFQEEDLLAARFFANQAGIAVRQTQLAASADAARNMLAAFYEAARDLGESESVDEVLRRALASAAALTISSHGTVLLLDDTGGHVAYRVSLDSENVAPLQMVAGPMMRQGLAGWVVRERRAALIDDTEQDDRWLPGPGLGDIRSALAVPLIEGGRPFGVMTLAHVLPYHYSADHLRLLVALSAQAALAIRSVQRFSAPQGQEANALGEGTGDTATEVPSVQDVVILFVGLRGFTRASERLAPEVLVKEVLDRYVQAMMQALQHYDAYVDQCSGDRILAAFGYPAHQPDDVPRAIRAALAMRQTAGRMCASWRSRLGIDLGIAIGISRGHVAVGRVGHPGRADYTVIGDAVGMAGRLQRLGRRGEILATADVIDALDRAGSSFTIEALPPLSIQRYSGMQQIYRVGEPPACPKQQAARDIDNGQYPAAYRTTPP